MSLPNYLATIKSSGIYRFEWDYSQIQPSQAETLRLLVGYSTKGPFNTPVYCESYTDFVSTFGNLSKRLERKGCFFHRSAEQALSTGPILALNLKPFSTETLEGIGFDASELKSGAESELDTLKTTKQVTEIYDTSKFWTLDVDSLPEKLKNVTDKYIYITATDTKETSCSVFMRRVYDSGYDLTIREWYNGQNEEMPSYLESIQDKKLTDFFVEMYVFRGEFTRSLVENNGIFSKYLTNEEDEIFIKTDYKDAFGDNADALEALAYDSASNFVGKYYGCLIPYFKNTAGTYVSIDLVFNSDNYKHKMLMKLNENLLDDAEDDTTALQYLKIDDTYAVTTSDGTTTYPKIQPIYLEGYKYTTITNDLEGSKLQDELFKVLSYKGIRTALTSRIDIEYHYLVDTFMSYAGGTDGIKSILAAICKEKKNSFAFINFVSAQNLKSDPKYMTTSGNVTYLDFAKVTQSGNGCDLASSNNGASYCGYFTPVVISDGTVKTTIPSAALVSNLFMDKWGARHPYDIVAGPNYGTMTWDGLQGPEYAFSRTDLDYLEPFGVNCMVYTPRKGTYINSNQTAQQTPVSALSKINVRELVIYLQDEIEYMLEGYHWDLNTQTLRDTIKSKADTILETVKNNGGVYAYNNWVDDSADIIDNEMVVLHTEIEPARGAGKMVEEIHIYRTGALQA